MAASVLVVVFGSAFGPDGVCATTTATDSATTIASVRAPAIRSIRFRICITPPSPRRSIRRIVQPNRGVHHLFDKRHAIELDQLGVRLQTAVNREADLPRPCIDG